jgi:hypothetical protein
MPQSIGEALLGLNAGVFSVHAISGDADHFSINDAGRDCALAAFQIHGAPEHISAE